MRITTPEGKVGYLIAVPVVLILLQLLAGAISDFGSSALLAALGVVGQLAFVIVGVRTFRGTGEPVRPARAWWRMTARPPAGYLLGGLFLAQAAWWALAPGPSPLAPVAATVSGLIGLAYLAATVRLARHLRGA